MPADVTSAAVLDAISECDRVGLPAFQRSAGVSRSTRYRMIYLGRQFDPNAILAYASASLGISHPPDDGSQRGEKDVADRLKQLGYTVRMFERYPWTYEEIVLACALVEASGWKTVAQEDGRAIALSRLLQTTRIHPVEGRGPNFRNPASVERKSSDLVTSQPDYLGARTNGNKLDAVVVREFLDHGSEMRQLAAAIRADLEDDGPADLPAPDLDEIGAHEGRATLRAHLRRERNPALRRAKVSAAKRQGLALSCEVCAFDFFQFYGDHGFDYIECHHRVPLHASGETLTKLDDLALICSNCHRMIHHKDPWLSVEELRALVEAQRGR